MLEKEAIEKGIDVGKLRDEQRKMSKLVSCEDAFDFKNATRYAGIYTKVLNSEILATAVVLDENLEVVEEKYAIKKITFPYIPSFRSYREMPVMLEVYKKVQEKPDVIFIDAFGIAHPRGLGLASHFGLSVNKPIIGITKNILVGIAKGDFLYIKNKKVAKKIITRQGSKPIFVSIGNMISLDTAVKITKESIKEPHKLPEPLFEARKFASKIKEELKGQVTE